MKCVCGAEMEDIETELELFDGSVSVRGVRGHHCPACGEDLFTSAQVEKTRDKLADLGEGDRPGRTR